MRLRTLVPVLTLHGVMPYDVLLAAGRVVHVWVCRCATPSLAGVPWHYCSSSQIECPTRARLWLPLAKLPATGVHPRTPASPPDAWVLPLHYHQRSPSQRTTRLARVILVPVAVLGVAVVVWV